MMKNTFKPLIVILALFLIFASVGIPVGAQGGIEDGTTSIGAAQTPQDFGTNAAVPGGPGFIMIHPTAFVPRNSTMEYDTGANGGALFNPDNDPSFYEAALNFPHGAKVIKVVVYYYDNSSTENFNVTLAAINLDADSSDDLAYLTTIGTSLDNRVMEDSSISSDIIDNQSCAYWIEVYMPGGQSINLMIRGIRIDYSYPVNLPLINR